MDAEVKATIVSPEQTAHAHRVRDGSTGRKSGCTSTAHDCGRPRRGDWGEARSVPRRRGQAGRWRQCAAVSTSARYAQRRNQGIGRREDARAPFTAAEGLRTRLWMPGGRSRTQAGPAGRDESWNNEGLSSSQVAKVTWALRDQQGEAGSRHAPHQLFHLVFSQPGCSALCSPHFPVGSKSWYHQPGVRRMKLRSRQCSNLLGFCCRC